MIKEFFIRKVRKRPASSYSVKDQEKHKKVWKKKKTEGVIYVPKDKDYVLCIPITKVQATQLYYDKRGLRMVKAIMKNPRRVLDLIK